MQRNLSARIPKVGGEITHPVNKSTPDLVTSLNQPVFLKPLTNVTTSKFEVRRPFGQSDEKLSVIKPVHNCQNSGHTVKENSVSDEKKKSVIKSSATFSLQKSASHEFLANKSLKGTNMNRNSDESETKQQTGFNVVLRKTNRSLIDNEEQEKNFRHSVDLDFRESSKIPVSNGVVNNSATREKLIETDAKPKIITNVPVSSSLQSKFINGSAEKKNPSGAISAINGEILVQKSNQQKEAPKPVIKQLQKPQQKDMTKIIDTPEQKVDTLPAVQIINKAARKKSQDPPNQTTVKSSVQCKPVTIGEARAVASGGERQNLLQEIQNFKRKPNPNAEQNQSSEGQTDNSKIVKSSIKPSKYW